MPLILSLPGAVALIAYLVLAWRFGALWRGHVPPFADHPLREQGVVGGVLALHGLALALQFGQLGADQLDRGKGRAQLMRGGGDDTAQMLQFLFPFKRHTGGKQRLGRGGQFGGDAAGKAGKEHRADDDRQPMPRQ